MKKFYYLLLLCTGLLAAQPVINDPAPLSICAPATTFDLTAVIPEVLGSLNPATNTILFHHSEQDALDLEEPIATDVLTAYVGDNDEVIWISVTDTTDGLVAVTSLTLQVGQAPTATMTIEDTILCQNDYGAITFIGSNASAPYTFYYTVNGVAQTVIAEGLGISFPLPTEVGVYNYELTGVLSGNGCYSDASGSASITRLITPTAYPAQDLVVYETPNDGVATFDLTQNASAIVNGQPGVFLIYFNTQAGAESGSGEIINPLTFTNTTNPQTIWVRVNQGGNGCFVVTSFDVAVVDTDEVYIPDLLFKNSLITGLSGPMTPVDTNEDGKIQVSEAAAVTLISVNLAADITDITGIKSFVNLETFNAMNNKIISADLSGLASLKTVYLMSNNLTSLNVEGMTSLETLYISENNLTNLEIADLPNLKYISGEVNNLATVNLTNLPLLETLSLNNNELTTLDVGDLTALTALHVESNHLVTLDLTAITALIILGVNHNALTNIDISGLSALEMFDFSNNPNPVVNMAGADHIGYLRLNSCGWSSFDVPPLPDLIELECELNSIPSIDFSLYPALKNVRCGSNLLTDVDVSMLQDLEVFSCPGNQFTTLDFNSNPNLFWLSIYMNPLESLFIKNGAAEMFDMDGFGENVDLKYICADEFQVEALQEMAGTTIQVNTYCSFVPGGDYNTITGTAKFDSNNNGCADDTEQGFVKLSVFDGTDYAAVFTTPDAEYNIFTGVGTFTITPEFESDIFTISPATAEVIFPVVDNSISTNNFCITANGIHPDVEIAIAPIVRAVPGFDAVYEIVYKNKGNQVLSQTGGIAFAFNDAVTDYLSASETPAAVGVGTLTWDYSNLQPFESRSIQVTLHVNPPTDPSNPVNIDDVLIFTANVLPVANDEIPADNTFEFNQVVVGSFDPNDKHCLQGTAVSETEIGEYLHYIINFENTGTAAATNIVVTDEIDPTRFDISTLQILGSSHAVNAKVEGNKAEFVFQNINLESGGHGNILLKMRTLSSLAYGDVAKNEANIFFDYNFPILTNRAETVFGALGVNDPKTDSSISVYPNPVSDVLTLKASASIISVQLFDVQGRLLQTKLTNESEVTLDVAGKSSGIYFVKVTTQNGTAIEKIVKK